jgi:3'-phosphoadenosine 5'-phosphosulfate sulfotransferase (PAPS reductase)/FAD synthetase
MHRKVLGKKQSEDNNRFIWAFQNIRQLVSKQHMDNLIDRTVSEVKSVVGSKQAGFGWSGGKDSVALEFIMKQVGIERCVMGMTHDLEYPEFLQFVTDNMPDGLEVHDSGQDLVWLSKNLHMLFPQDSRTAALWFKQVQHKAQVEFYKRHNLDIILLGRRSLDSNYTGKGSNMYQNKEGVLRYSPLKDWTHEEVIACMHYYNLPVAPLYSWPNGWIVGSGCWPARQWTGSHYKAWYELYIIDKAIVEKAARHIESAKSFLEQR